MHKPRCTLALLLASLLFMATAHAEIDIQIPEVTEALAANVRSYLSLSRYAERKDVTPEVMSRLQRRIVSETNSALEPLGYYEPEVEYRVVQNGERWTVTILIKPGRPVRVSEVTLTVLGAGENEGELREIIVAEELKAGLRLNHGTYERVKGELIRTAKNLGYLDARLTRNELVVDRTERRATIALELTTGERYHYGKIEIAQDALTDDAMIRLLRMREGDPYTLDSLLRTQYFLDDSQYFSAVDIDSGEPERSARTVAVTITATPARRNRYGVSLGYGTDTKVRGKFTWDNRRVNQRGHRFKTELIGSSVIKQIAARYAVPVMDIALEKVEFTAIATDEELGDTFSERAELGVGLTQVVGRWQRVASVRFSNEKTREPDRPDSTDFYIIPSISFTTLPSYVLGDKARPYYLYAELRGSPSTFGSDASFLQIRLLGERIFDLSERWHLRLRSELGASRVDESSDLPASQRFFAGGERSVRGFALDELSPRRDGKSVGGRYLATGSVEVERDLPRNFAAAVFYDIGNAFDDYEVPQLEYAAGVGVRYRIAVASLGIDVAQPLSISGRNPRFHLYISTQF